MAKENAQSDAPVVADPVASEVVASTPDPTAAHGVLSEIEAKLRQIRDRVIAWDHRELAKLEALVAKLRSHL